MFGLGAGEVVIILVLALIFIGPKKLPELARSLGKSLREFQKAKDELMHELDYDDSSKSKKGTGKATERVKNESGGAAQSETLAEKKESLQKD